MVNIKESVKKKLKGKEFRNHRFDVRYKQEDLDQVLTATQKDCGKFLKKEFSNILTSFGYVDEKVKKLKIEINGVENARDHYTSLYEDLR